MVAQTMNHNFILSTSITVTVLLHSNVFVFTILMQLLMQISCPFDITRNCLFYE